MKLDQLVVEAEDEGNGTFVGVKFTEDACDKLVDMMDKMGLDNPTPRDDLHTTVMYTLKPIPEFVEDHPEPLEFDPPKVATGETFHIFPSQESENVLVLRLTSDYLHNRHNEIIDEYNAEYTHDNYIPHVTLMYTSDEIDLSDWNIDDYDTNFRIASEYNSPLDPEWK